jgi:hypothetical protein
MALISSQDVYVSTQISGSAGSGTNNFDNFRVCFSADPLRCEPDEILRMSITQFNAYRNFNYVNDSNYLLLFSNLGGADRDVPLVMTQQDYADINSIGDNLATVTATLFDNISLGSRTWTGACTTTPQAVGGTGHRKLEITLTASGTHGLTASNLHIQAPHFTGGVTSVSGTGAYDGLVSTNTFSDSYFLLGGKACTTAGGDTSFDSFTITAPTTSTLKIEGFYPMTRTTMPYIYLRCENAGENQESINLNTANTPLGTHMVQSNIVAKIPVGDVVCATQFDALSPYFVNLNSKQVSELRFFITDHVGRSIPKVADNQDTLGNLQCDFTMKIDRIKFPIVLNYLDIPRPEPSMLSSVGLSSQRFATYK